MVLVDTLKSCAALKQRTDLRPPSVSEVDTTPIPRRRHEEAVGLKYKGGVGVLVVPEVKTARK